MQLGRVDISRSRAEQTAFAAWIPAFAGMTGGGGVEIGNDGADNHLFQSDVSARWAKTDDHRTDIPRFFAVFAPSRLCVKFSARNVSAP